MYLTTRERAFPLETGRGCPFSCTFCCNSKRYEHVRYRSLDNVLDEIRYVQEKFGVHAFQIYDETFSLKRNRAEEFCRRLINERLDIRWETQTRASLVDVEIVELMKKAGCLRLSIGVESGDPVVLRAINKGIELQEAMEAVRVINAAGIVSYAGFMIGHPDDTLETVVRTIEFADALDPSFVGFRVAIPYPGCVFREIAEKKGRILTDDLSLYTDDNTVYVPPGLEGYDLQKIRKMAYTWYLMRRPERLERMNQQFSDPYRDTFEEILKGCSGIGRRVPPVRELLDAYCRESES